MSLLWVFMWAHRELAVSSDTSLGYASFVVCGSLVYQTCPGPKVTLFYVIIHCWDLVLLTWMCNILSNWFHNLLDSNFIYAHVHSSKQDRCKSRKHGWGSSALQFISAETHTFRHCRIKANTFIWATKCQYCTQQQIWAEEKTFRCFARKTNQAYGHNDINLFSFQNALNPKIFSPGWIKTHLIKSMPH